MGARKILLKNSSSKTMYFAKLNVHSRKCVCIDMIWWMEVNRRLGV